MDSPFDTLLLFFKVLGNENRLRMAGLLAQRDYTVSDLAGEMGLRESTVSEYLAMFREFGLVTVRPVGTSRVYSFNAATLTEMNKLVHSREQLASISEESPENYELRVMQSFVKDGRITSFPAALKKQLVLLTWIARQIEPGREYGEKEISAFLKGFNDDYATIRRELVDWHFMTREAGRYWLLPESEWRTDPSGRHVNS